MADPEKAPRVIEAFMKMSKFDIQTLLTAVMKLMPFIDPTLPMGQFR